MYMQARNGMGEIDWSGLLKDVVGGVVAYKTADTQMDLLKAQQQADLQKMQQAQQQALAYQYNPQFSPQYGVPSQSSNLMPILLIGAAGLAVVYFLMKD